VRSSNEILETWKIDYERRIFYQPKPWNQPTWTIPQEVHLLKDSYINHDILSTTSCLLLQSTATSVYSLLATRHSNLQFRLYKYKFYTASSRRYLALEVQPSSNKSQHVFIYLINPRSIPGSCNGFSHGFLSYYLNYSLHHSFY